MSSRLTMGLAVLLLLGAIIAGYWGLVLSREPQTEPLAPPAEELDQASAPASPSVQQRVQERIEQEQRVDVVVLARDLPALQPIVAEDLAVERLLLAPPDSFTDADVLIGRSTGRALPAGSVLNASSFDMGGPLARMIRPQERALAIEVDEVISGGGHLRPGDYVDVLVYLREGERNREETAQVVVPALRVLSLGSMLGATLSGEAAQPALSEEEQQERRRRPEVARTAVLAVPESLVTRFMLASEVGRLRLSVRSVDERLLADYYAGDKPASNVQEINRQLFQFEKLALRPAPRPQSGQAAPRAPDGIEVYRGSSVSRQTP